MLIKTTTMKTQSQKIREMIDILKRVSSANVAFIVVILDAINRRMDEIESASDRANHVANCLSNGIQPD